jgi:hypothetical protein
MYEPMLRSVYLTKAAIFNISYPEEDKVLKRIQKKSSHATDPLFLIAICRNGVMVSASPAVLSSLHVVDGIAVPGFTRSCQA